VSEVDEQLTDQQQADIVRQWVRENGAFILGGLVLGLGGLFGWNQWQDYLETRAEQASEVYESIVVSIGMERTTKAEELLAELESAYGGSPYVDQARLVVAKSYLDRSEFDTGAHYLSRTVDESDSAQMRHVARLRLARVYIQQQRIDEALALVDKEVTSSAFTAAYHELRGDIYYLMDRFEEARLEYGMALGRRQQPPVIDRIFVQAKLDDLAVADEGEATPFDIAAPAEVAAPVEEE
jgi:predicted negative regulator of RcsB-dependent stress response